MKNRDFREFSETVRRAMGRYKITQAELAQKMGISQAHLSRMLRNIRPWQDIYIEKVSQILDINRPANLFSKEVNRVPLFGIISDASFQQIKSRKSGKEIMLNLEKSYRVDVGDDSLMPCIRKNSILFVKISPEQIDIGDLVIYVDQEHNGWIYYFMGSSDIEIYLKSISKAYPDRKIPTRHFAILDRVIMIIYP